MCEFLLFNIHTITYSTAQYNKFSNNSIHEKVGVNSSTYVYNMNVECFIMLFLFCAHGVQSLTNALLHSNSYSVSLFTCGHFLVFGHLRATCSISSTVSSLSLGFPMASPLLISTLSIFSQSENTTGFTPTDDKT